MSEYPKSRIAATTESHSASQVEELSNGIKVPAQFADESFKLFSKIQVAEPTPKEAIVIRNKCLWRIIPFLCIGYHLMYVDKQTTQYNWLSSIFYLGYLIAEWPQNWALQLFPVGKWLARNLIIWCCIILLHAPCNSSASLFVVRFLLGLAEACIVPAFLIIMSMFFTYGEEAVIMPIMWSIGNASPITSGLLSYGVLWIDTGDFAPWKWFMGMSALDCIDTTYKDAPHTPAWLFSLHAWSQEMANGMTNQYSLIINSFGFTVLQTTLLSTVSGVVSFFSLGTAAIVLYHTKNCRAWISLVAYIPAILSSILLLGRLSNRWGPISATWIRSTAGILYAVVMVWAANASAGHTKKTTVIALTMSDTDLIFLYPPGHTLCALAHQVKSTPILASANSNPYVLMQQIAAILPIITIIVLRVYLVRENKRRDRLQAADQVASNGVVEILDSDGTQVARVVDNSEMDLTDRVNLTL
ncbi:major facilitator superfamily domain-containing protein [Aspergillus foveolatus]|uniref:major facilitator superfamily domain-containing protein n=1 Tax=Aspergillus foveolatus TaxID=210207 RepID=UPI003CCD6DF7